MWRNGRGLLRPASPVVPPRNAGPLPGWHASRSGGRGTRRDLRCTRLGAWAPRSNSQLVRPFRACWPRGRFHAGRASLSKARQVTGPSRTEPCMSTCMTRLTGLTSHAGALVAALVVLNGAAIACGGAAVADPNQDEQFLALLDDEGIPAVKGVPSLIYTAHEVCRKLDAGMSATGLVDKMVNDAYGVDPPERLYAPGRLARTEARFITAAVEVYCPYDQGKIASIEAISAAGWNVPTHRVIPYTHDAVNSAGELPKLPSTWDTSALSAPRQQPASTGIAFASLIGAVPSGEINEPTPPQLPTPSPPGAHLRTAPRPVATPPRPKHLPPPPQQPPPPAVGPQPGDAAGGGGIGGGGTGGGTGGGGSGGGGHPVEPAPAPPMPPGFVTLAP